MKPNNTMKNRSKSLGEFSNHNNDDDASGPSSSKEPITMSKGDCLKLLSKMQEFGAWKKMSPTDWESIKFGNFSAQECRTTYAWLWRKTLTHIPSRDKFELISKHVTRMKEASFYNVKFPKSAYLLFFSEIQPRLFEKYPNLSQAEIMKKIAHRWQKLSEEEKQKYQADSERRKKEFQEELKEMGISNSSKIQRPKSAFQLFCEEKKQKLKAKHPEADDEKIEKKLERRWEKLSEDSKMEFKNKSAEMEKIFIEAKKNLPKSKKRKNSTDEIQNSSEAKKAKITKSELPPKPGTNLYNFWFVNDWKNHPRFKNLEFGERSKIAGEVWHEISLKEKEELISKWEKALFDYNEKLEKKLTQIENEEERKEIRSKFIATMPDRTKVLKALKASSKKKN